MGKEARDRMATLKLLGALIRLAVSNDGRFTARALADAACVEFETARAFLGKKRGPGYTEVIGRQAEVIGGRPANTYRVRVECMEKLLERVSVMSRSLDGAVGDPMPERELIFAPLSRAESLIRAATETDDGARRSRRLGEAQLELASAKQDLLALQDSGSVYAGDFEHVLRELEGRVNNSSSVGVNNRQDEILRKLDAVKRMLVRLKAVGRKRPAMADVHRMRARIGEVVGVLQSAKGDILESLEMQGSTGAGIEASEREEIWSTARESENEKLLSKYDLIGQLVENFGSWEDNKADSNALYPKVVALNGIKVGSSEVLDEIVENYATMGVAVARFDIARMRAQERNRFYATLDKLRGTTPLAVCPIVLAVDESEGGRRLVKEARRLTKLGSWGEKERNALPGDVELEEVRKFFMAKCIEVSIADEDEGQVAFVRRATSALAAVAAAEATSEKGLWVGFEDPIEKKRRLWGAAREFMGEVVKVDARGILPVEVLGAEAA